MSTTNDNILMVAVKAFDRGTCQGYALQDAYKELNLALQWLDNLEAKIGTEALIDAMPNNWHGRYAISELIKRIEDNDLIDPEEDDD